MNKRMIVIKSVLGDELFSHECSDIVEALECAVQLRINLCCADLRGQRLAGVNLYGGLFAGANFSGADLRSANLVNLQADNASFTGADLRDARMQLSSFRSANFTAADMDRVTMMGSDVMHAVFNDVITNCSIGVPCDQPSVGTRLGSAAYAVGSVMLDGCREAWRLGGIAWNWLTTMRAARRTKHTASDNVSNLQDYIEDKQAS